MVKMWMAVGMMLAVATAPVYGQTNTQETRATAQSAAPAAPTPHGAASEESFPKINPKNFTATSPTSEEVDSFLKNMWGFDPNRSWSVAAILKTPAPGVAKVVVLVREKSQPSKLIPSVFYTTPDGKHAISDNIINFGAHPFVELRDALRQRADGPAYGAKSNDLLLVEFADLDCARCAEAQEKMNQLATDFPQARIVFEDAPASVHPFAEQAGLDGVCVRKTAGDAAFFSFVRSVYTKQAGLTKESASAALDAAITAAGADPKAVDACAATPEAHAALDSSAKLAHDLWIEETPMLVANGRVLPIATIPYETLKQIIAYQAGLDGITVHLQPTLTDLK